MRTGSLIALDVSFAVERLIFCTGQLIQTYTIVYNL